MSKKEEKKLTGEEWKAERARLSDEVKKAQQALWEHVHPVIEDPQVVAKQEAWEARQSEKKSGKFVASPSGKGGLGFTPDEPEKKAPTKAKWVTPPSGKGGLGWGPGKK